MEQRIRIIFSSVWSWIRAPSWLFSEGTVASLEFLLCASQIALLFLIYVPAEVILAFPKVFKHLNASCPNFVHNESNCWLVQMLRSYFFTLGNNLESHLESKHGASTPYLQISDSISTSRALKQRIKKKKKGETRQCQTGMTEQAGISENEL